ncbi:hypothetical protein HK097_010302, partial [Rhizophlyctis rosea]
AIRGVVRKESKYRRRSIVVGEDGVGEGPVAVAAKLGVPRVESHLPSPPVTPERALRNKVQEVKEEVKDLVRPDPLVELPEPESPAPDSQPSTPPPSTPPATTTPTTLTTATTPTQQPTTLVSTLKFILYLLTRIRPKATYKAIKRYGVSGVLNGAFWAAVVGAVVKYLVSRRLEAGRKFVYY